jgi:nitrate reductase gamma subunit
MQNDIQEVDDQIENQNWKTGTIIVGGIVGALTGLGAAYLLVRRAEEQGDKISMTSGQGLKLGVLLAGLIRSILNLSED